MRYFSLRDILELHDKMIEASGGVKGIREIRTFESAINQSRLPFNQTDFYPGILKQAAAPYFFLGMNYLFVFVDDNKKTGRAAMETFLTLNGLVIDTSLDEQEKIIFDLTAGILDGEKSTVWINNRTTH